MANDVKQHEMMQTKANDGVTLPCVLPVLAPFTE